MQERNQDFNTFISNTCSIFTTRESKEAWRRIKSLTKYNLIGKKEGKIIDRIRDPQTEEVVIGTSMNQIIINHFERLHKEDDETNRCQYYFQTPNIDVSTSQAYQISNIISSNKALSWDCIQDTSFKECVACRRGALTCIKCNNKFERIKDVFKSRFWDHEKSFIHLQARLIALDKAYPNIATESQYRPIVITSSIVKILEAYVVPSLRKYGTQRLNRNQVGFILGRSTLDNLVRLHFECKKIKKGFMIFIDLSSAYDRVNRKILYWILEQKEILNIEERQIIKFLHSNISVKVGSQQCKTERGVPQGLMTSPMLFNIFIESLLDKMDSAGIVTLAYADDLVMVVKNEIEVRIAINILEEWTEESSMKINREKSGIIEMCRRKTFEIGDNIKGYKFLKSYKYLGVDLEGKNNMNNHFRRIRKKVFMILSKIRMVTEKMSFHKRRILIRTLVVPHIDYIGAMALLNGKRATEQAMVLSRRATRVVYGLGYNTKCIVINTIQNSDRRYKWKERLNKIIEKWKDKEIEWQYGNTILEEDNEYPQESEICIKELDPGVIDIINIFNRTKCTEHNTYLGEYHLEHGHNLKISYESIIEMIRSKNNRMIKELSTQIKALII